MRREFESVEDEEICDHIAAHTAVVLDRRDLIHAEVVRRNYRTGIVLSHRSQQFSFRHAIENLVIETPGASVSLAKRSQPVPSAKAPRLKKAMEQISWVAPSEATVLIQENRGPVTLQNSWVRPTTLRPRLKAEESDMLNELSGIPGRWIERRITYSIKSSNRSKLS